MGELYRKTPLMGWASWNCFRTHISEEIMKEQADALVKTGLADCGYTYFNMDDGFFGGRAADGQLLFHKERFPNGIKVIADYAHSLGLKAGIYTDGGDNTCGHYYDGEDKDGAGVGLYGYEERDLRMFLVDCGYDFIKVDWCGGVRLGLDEEEQYTKIGNIIDDIRRETGRQLVYNICRWQFPGLWAAKVADSWRTGADIAPNFDSVMYQIDMIKPLARYASPGHVNDLDMMQLGNGGMTHEEEKTHFAMWCMMSTPLMIGCDIRNMSEETKNILLNKDVIAINQDPEGRGVYEIDHWCNQSCKGLVKPLENGDYAICLVNFADGEHPAEISFNFWDMGLTYNSGFALEFYDCWEHKTVGTFRERFSAHIMPHSCRLYRVKLVKI